MYFDASHFSICNYFKLLDPAWYNKVHTRRFRHNAMFGLRLYREKLSHPPILSSTQSFYTDLFLVILPSLNLEP